MNTTQLLAKLDAMRPKPDKVPNGWLTVSEIVTETGKSKPWVLKRLRLGLEMRTVKRHLFRICNCYGTVRKIPHYKFL